MTLQEQISQIQDAVFGFVVSGGSSDMSHAKLGKMLEELVTQAKRESFQQAADLSTELVHPLNHNDTLIAYRAAILDLIEES